MREIKFRCWDKENKEMLDVEYLHWDDCTREFSIRTTMYSDYFDTEDMILMQYTGLKDKNGKEIYEGDLLKLHYIKNGLEEIKASVIYSDDYAQYVIKDTKYVSDNYEPLCDYEDLEVIGNVWEDSDLLNDSKNTKSN